MGSEKPDAVYSIFGFWETIPHPHVSLLLAGERMAKNAAANDAIIRVPTTAISGRGAEYPAIPKSCRENTPSRMHSAASAPGPMSIARSEEHTPELQSQSN